MAALSPKAWRAAALAGSASLIAGAMALPAPWAASPAVSAEPAAPSLETACTAEAAQAAANGLSTKVTVQPIKFAIMTTATRYVAAKGTRGAFCQVGGSFVTNPKSGKTANFLATFPANWNGKYLQLGCSGHCGQFYVSDPALPTVTVTAQGYGSQIIEKGYATFATDEGHTGMDGASWAVKSDGSVDQDGLDDLFYRADKVMARMGKEFTAAFYARVNGKASPITRSYFNGCSGGGRDAMVAASYFPEEFDGIIAGSPYDMIGMTFQGSAIGAAVNRPGGNLAPDLFKLLDRTVQNQCDGIDGVKDGLIQNPAACNFVAERDLPICKGGEAAGQCFTKKQAETVSVALSAVTDEKGNVIQPGYSVSEFAAIAPQFTVSAPTMAALTDPTLKIFVHRNDPAYNPQGIFTFARRGKGSITAFHAVVPSSEVAKAIAALSSGAGHLPGNVPTFMRSKTKLLMWHNFSDEKLTPFSSVNWYKRLAARYGSYAKAQAKARLFMLPGTTHCSIAGIAPNSFDSLSAMENWVEKGQAPDALKATVAFRDYTPGAPKAPNLSTPNYTMPLCKFPEMARYSGKGDKQDAANWSCSAKDARLLIVGESGRQGGVVR